MNRSVLTTLMMAWSESAASPLLSRLDSSDRLHVLATIVILLVIGALLMLFAHAAGRIARWYMGDWGTSATAPCDEFKQPQSERAHRWQVPEDPA